MMRKKEILLNAGIFLLLVLLFVQCGFFLARYNLLRQNADFPTFDEIISSETVTETEKIKISDFLLPQSTAIRTKTGSGILFGSRELTAEIFALFSDLLTKGLSSSPEQAENGAELLTDRNFVLFSFGTELPLSVFSALTYATTANAENQYIGIKQMLFLPDESGKFTQVFFFGSTGLWCIRDIEMQDTAPDFLTVSEFETRFTENFLPCTFTEKENSISVSLSERYFSRKIRPYGYTSFIFVQNAQHITEFLPLFSFNPDKANYRMEEDGSKIYVETHGQLRLEKSGISYAATEAGGVSLTDGKTLQGMLRYCFSVIDKISQMDKLYVGGDAVLGLESVTADGDKVIVSFGYRLENIPVLVRGELQPALSFTFCDGKLIGFSLIMMSVQKTTQYEYIPLSVWVGNVLQTENDTAELVYYMDMTSTETVTAEWIFADPKGADDGLE